MAIINGDQNPANVNDVLYGTPDGLNETDYIDGLTGNDTIYGRDGNDSLKGGVGNDTIDGGTGNDYILGGAGQDYLDGGDGIDDVDYRTFNGDGIYNLATGAANLIGAFTETMLNFENIFAGGGNDTITGTAGNNFLSGGAGNDTIYGGAGNDSIYGGTGDDTIQGGLGQDDLYGGAGNDTADYTTFNGNATYDLGANTANLGVFTEVMYEFENISTGAGDDTIYGSSANNIINANAGDDKLYGDAGNDIINGGNGNDFIQGGLGQDTLDGGAGDFDTVDYTTFNGNGIYNLGAGTANLGVFTEVMLNFENIFAGGGNDTITGTSVDNFLSGGGGNDTIQGGAGNDIIGGEAGDDTIQGGAGQDYLYGGAGSDTVDYTTFNGGGNYNLATGFANLTGAFIETMNSFENIKTGNGDDVITGTTGDNKIYGGAGNDTILAGDGNDYVQGGLGLDYLDGGAGIDTVDYTTFNGGGTYELRAGLANLTGAFQETMKNFENIKTGAGNDTIIGDEGFFSGFVINSIIDAGAGDDTIYGNGGIDTIYGGAGNDIIGAGNGDKDIYGGIGNDLFIFSGRTDIPFGANTIHDFTKGEDKIVLDLSNFQGITIGNDFALQQIDFEIINSAAGIQNATKPIVYNLANGDIFGKIGSPNGYYQFANTPNIVGVSTLSASDFTLSNIPV